jgi:hypothetical protein
MRHEAIESLKKVVDELQKELDKKRRDLIDSIVTMRDAGFTVSMVELDRPNYVGSRYSAEIEVLRPVVRSVLGEKD